MDAEPAPEPSPTEASEPSGDAVPAPPPAPEEPSLREAPSAPRTAPPPVARTVATAFDALVTAGADLRLLSLVLGLFAVIFVALPFGATLLYGTRSAAVSLFASGQEATPGIVNLASLGAVATALAALVALVFETQILVAATVGGHIAGAPLLPREALKRSRQVFWTVVSAAFLVGLIVVVFGVVAETLVGAFLGASSELAAGGEVLASIVVAAPFVYVLPGIVLGGVGAGEAVRRSWRLARVRWRLALAISAFAVLGQVLLVMAVGVALDLVATALELVGGSLDLLAGLTPLAAVVGYLVLASAGASLLLAVMAVQVAPQVAGFFAMTRYVAGLDGARGGKEEPIFHRPAVAVYGFGLLCAAVVATAAFLLRAPAADAQERVTVTVDGLVFQVPARWSQHGSGELPIAVLNPSKTAGIFLFAGEPYEPKGLLPVLRSTFEAGDLQEVEREGVSLADAPVEEVRFVIPRSGGAPLRGVADLGRIAGVPALVAVLYDPSLTTGGLIDLDRLVLSDAIRFTHSVWTSAR